MFSQDSTQLSANVDFLKYATSGTMGDVGLIFDPQHKDTIYIEAVDALKAVNPIHSNL